jgi:molybdenum cofactor cytidylyltransferase
MISGIVLAAGEAKRLGRQKLLLDLRGKPVLQWVLEAALSSGLDEVICVVRDWKEVRPKIDLDRDQLRWTINELATRGQSTSVIAGLRAISPQSDAALFLVGDQPLIQSDLIEGIIDLYKRARPLIAAPTFQGRSRNPVIFDRSLFPELLDLTGDRGGKALIERYREETAFLEWGDEAPFLDLDVWSDYERLKSL